MLIQNNYQSRMGVPLFYYSSSPPTLSTTILPMNSQNNSNDKISTANSFNNYYPVTPPYTHQYDYQLKSFPVNYNNQHQYTSHQLQHLRLIETSSSPLINTPPITPPSASSTPGYNIQVSPQLSSRNSVIMKVKDHQITHVMSNLNLSNKSLNDNTNSDFEEILCKWEKCYKNFNTLEELSAHVSQVHATSGLKGLYYCKWEGCSRMDRGFNARYKMLVHSRTHTKDKPHQCSECHKCFSRAENLKIHKRSHSGEKPYLCPVEGCNKAYSNSSDRFKHTRTHTNDKPYVCKVPGCQKRYTDPSSLRKHLKTFKHPAAEPLISSDSSQENEIITNTKVIEDKMISKEEENSVDSNNMVFSRGVLYQNENSNIESVEERYAVADYEQYAPLSLTNNSDFYENDYYIWNGKTSDSYDTENMPLDLSIGRR